jgi:hydrogenase small subunit
VGIWGGILRSLRSITNRTVNKEPKWRHPRPELTTGYQPKYYANGRN